MNNKIQCPFSSSVENNDIYRPVSFYRKQKLFFLFSGLFLFIILPCFAIFYAAHIGIFFESIAPIIIVWTLLFISLLFIYQNSIRAKINKNLPMCGIFTVFYDVLCRQKILLRDIDVERKNKYGDIYLSFFGLRPVIIITSSTLAEQISKDYIHFSKSDPRDLNMPYFYQWVGNNNIVLANGERWQEMRKLVHPVVNEVENFLPIMNKKTIIFCEKIENEILQGKNTSSGTTIKLTRWLKALSLDIAGEALFGYNFNHLNEQSNPGILATDYILNEIFSPARVSLPILNHLPISSNKRLKNAMAVLDTLVSDMITYYSLHQNNCEQSKNKNVLSMLIDGINNDFLTSDELRNNILALVLASHETTQVSLSGVLYYLAKYPDLQNKLREESIELFPNLEAAFSMQEGEVDKKTSPYWKLKTFKNLDNFILESLRLYSPLANQNPRTTIQDMELNGFKIPKGTLVIMNLHAIHMSNNEWDEPEKFLPDRFNKGNRGNKYAFLPFGNGPRICSGREFSLIEQKLVICYLLRKFKLSLPAENYAVPIMRYSFTGLPDETFSLTFEKIE